MAPEAEESKERPVADPEGSGADGARPPGVVGSLVRALRLLDCFKHGRPEMTLGEFVRESGLSKTTTYRLLTTLEYAGWLERTPDAAFRLTIKPFQIGSILVDSLELRHEAGPIMAELAERLRETVYLVVPVGRHAVCLERIDSGSAVRVMALQVGGSQLLNLGAGPRALLAWREDDLMDELLSQPLEAPTENSIAEPDALRADLAESRERGYTIALGDVTPQVGAVGAPVFDRTGGAIAAISVTGLIERFTPPAHERYAEALVDACGRLSMRLGFLTQVDPRSRVGA
jgi:DNA-binding IclR family transcriptional regulator